MKKIKYMFMGAMMTVISAPVMAQTDAASITKQVAEIIKSAPVKDATKQVSALAKTYKKDAQALSAIGRAYLNAKDFENANKYADMAIKADKNTATPYVLKGDVCAVQDDGGGASGWYEQAIYFDKKSPDAYIKFARANSKTSPAQSNAKLEELAAARPDLDVYPIAAEIQSNAGNYAKAAESYGKASREKMNDSQLTDYALCLWMTSKNAEAYEIAKYGVGKFPKNVGLNRLALYNATATEKYDEAVSYGDVLLNKLDSVTVQERDLRTFALALNKVGRSDEAVANYQKILTLDGVDEDVKCNLNREIADCYKSAANYTKAAEAYSKYLKAKGTPSASDYDGYASIFQTQALDSLTTPEDKAAAIANADKVYADMCGNSAFDAFKQNLLYKRVKLTYIADPESKEWKAVPFFEELIGITASKAEKTKTDNAILKEAYNYMMVYALKGADDLAKSKEYAELLLQLDPENATAKQIQGLK